MKRRSIRRGGRDASQLTIDWQAASKPSAEGRSTPTDCSASALTLYLRWDFKSTYPQPTNEAIDAGIISDEDATPEGIAAIHSEHARELLASLRELDAVLDARRRGVDPASGRPTTTPAGRERLKKIFATEPTRLERWWNTLIETYESAFGSEAADAFGKALRARHAGIHVEMQVLPAAVQEPSEVQPTLLRKARRTSPGRVIARLPVPQPLPSAVAEGRFGREENGKPIRPGPLEVREITQQYAEQLVQVLDSISAASPDANAGLLESFKCGIARYAEDFGPGAGEQLEAYVKRQAGLDAGSRRGR